MKNIIFTLLISILTFTTFFAQEVKNKNEEDTQSGSIKIPNETQATNDKVEFKNETGNSILTITDEGNDKGSITLPAMSAAPSNTSNKLYNDGGTLKFNGSSLGGGSGTGVSEIDDLTDAKYDGASSIFLGADAGSQNTGTNNKSTAIGRNALAGNQTGGGNTALGFYSLTSTTANSNTAIGAYSLWKNLTGNRNVGIGFNTLYNHTGGDFNVAVGTDVLVQNLVGVENTAVENEAGRLSIGSGNVFLGNKAGYNEERDDRLYIENSDSDKPLIYGNFETDTIIVNGFMNITNNLAIGENNSAGVNSLSVGKNNSAIYLYNIQSGLDNFSMAKSTASFGENLKSSSYLATVLGRFNDDNLLYSNESWVNTEPLFVIGNGTDDANRANAFTVLKNGNTFINGNLKIIGIKVALGETANATGNNSFAIGSNANANGNNSFAIGSNVTAKENGSFIISDASNLEIQTSIENSFIARFDGGYKFYTDDNIGFGAELPSGASSWSTISDSTKKENFLLVNGEDVLNKISKFNLRSWNYKGQDPAKFRHYGPMAQEFYSAFGNDGIGTIGNDTTIASADFDGINLIAIQALEKRTKEQEIRIIELENQNQELAQSNLEFRNQNIQLRNINLELQNDIKQIKNIITEIKKEQNTTKIAELN